MGRRVRIRYMEVYIDRQIKGWLPFPFLVTGTGGTGHVSSAGIGNGLPDIWNEHICGLEPC